VQYNGFTGKIFDFSKERKGVHKGLRPHRETRFKERDTMSSNSCDMCSYYVYDEECDEYVCLASMDEDDYMRFITSKSKECPFFRLDDEYKIVRKQN